MVRRIILQMMALIVILTGCGFNVAERNDYGVQRYFEGDMEGAIDAFQAAQVVEPDNPILYFNMANALANNGQFEDAIQALELATQLDDDDLSARAFYNMGNVYFEMANYQAAIRSYQDALRLNPDDSDARHNLQLARTFQTLPTPTAMELQVEVTEDLANATATPTDQPADDFETPTATPDPQLEIITSLEPTLPPIGAPNQPSGASEGTFQPRISGTMTIEEAARILEPLQHDQRQMGEFLDTTATPGIIPGDKDW